ncbi:hypothetical protein uvFWCGRAMDCOMC403_09 [Freshwater phage uvFW-CGR-AMD-COM-C403]|jgi:hypothetical protein|nr:hypothetical protein uvFWCGRAMDCOMC403_09 [Freshwater phage uvFW-CGR-AMD-COM-C403]
MATLSQLVEQTTAEIGAYIKNQESITIITSSIDADDLTIAVDDVKSLSKGIVEIDEELLYVKKAIADSGTIEIIGMAGNATGRGWRGTTATSHVSGSIVRNNPLFPRSQVKRALLETIKGMNFPVIANETFQFNGSDYSYIMPDALEDITGISWDVPDSTGVWQIIKNWRLDTNYYDPATATTKQALVLKEAPMPGRDVRVQYTKFPTTITDNQELTVSGLPSSCEDVVRLGAMYRLLSTVDSGKVTAVSVSADALDQPVQAGASTSAAKYIFNLYTIRLAEEIAKQQANFLNIIQYTR